MIHTWGSIKGMEELTPSEVKHELRKQAEFSGQLETLGIILLIFSKPGNKLNEHSIQPPDHINRFFLKSLIHSISRH